MFAAWGPESDKTSTEKVKVESAKKRCMEKKNGAWREDLFHLIK